MTLEKHLHDFECLAETLNMQSSYENAGRRFVVAQPRRVVVCSGQACRYRSTLLERAKL